MTKTTMQAIQAYLSSFENYLQKQSFQNNPPELYQPIHYTLALGGKRVRPLLVFLGYQCFKPDWEKALPLAYAMELFHNFTLLHDDIMDKAPLRRGQATAYIKYGEPTAILAGDVMQVYVYEYLLQLEMNRDSILKTFNQTAIKVCEGQQMDMNFETQEQVSVGDYLEMIANKTAVLLGCCLQCGALLAGAPSSAAQQLYDCGLNMGIAFQLLDDYLDTFGGASFGKAIGGDIRQNKKTYLLLRALEKAEAKAAEELHFQLNEQQDMEGKVKKVTALYQSLGIDKDTNELISTYENKAFQGIEGLSINGEAKAMLADFARALFAREK
ncbi:MAG: polyprenyl synthetase family protein [Chitinophagales bacterium]|nr:polyprenyl synthetase family protein [Chitinophagales bacterium]